MSRFHPLPAPKQRSRLRRQLLHGPGFALPAWLDRCAESWWRTGPRARTIVAAVLAIGVTVAVGWGATSSPDDTVPVLVAIGDLQPGHRLAPTDLRRMDWPADLVPPGALREPDGVLSTLLPDGAAATTGHVHVDGLGLHLDPGRVAVAVPSEALPPLEPGTLLVLVGTDPDGHTRAVSDHAMVLRADESTTWLAVEREEAVAVSGVATAGRLGVVVLPS